MSADAIGWLVPLLCVLVAGVIAYGIESFQDLPEESEHDEHEDI